MIKKLLNLLKKDERGLTLVELLAVVVVLGIVGAIAFVSISGVIENSKKDAMIANAQQVVSAAKLYEASSGEIEGTLGNSNTSFMEYVGEVLDPWDNSRDLTKDGTIEVSKQGNNNVDSNDIVVKITGSGGVSATDKKCDIYATESALRELDRELLCGNVATLQLVTSETTDNPNFNE